MRRLWAIDRAITILVYPRPIQYNPELYIISTCRLAQNILSNLALLDALPRSSQTPRPHSTPSFFRPTSSRRSSSSPPAPRPPTPPIRTGRAIQILGSSPMLSERLRLRPPQTRNIALAKLVVPLKARWCAGSYEDESGLDLMFSHDPSESSSLPIRGSLEPCDPPRHR